MTTRRRQQQQQQQQQRNNNKQPQHDDKNNDATTTTTTTTRTTTAHFWVSYGRCAMPGSPMRWSEGLSRQLANLVAQVGSTKKHAYLHASGTLMAVLPCLDYL